MASVTVYELSGANSSGNKSLDFNFSTNKTRALKRFTCRLKDSNNNVVDTLTLEQAFENLFITDISQTNPYPVTSEGVDIPFTFQGTANGKYMKYTAASGIVVTSCSTPNTTISSVNYSQIDEFHGGTSQYNFTITGYVPANTASNNYTITAYTCDNTLGTDALSVTFTLQVTAASVSVTSVSLNQNSLTLTEGDTATLTATVQPQNATNKSITWSSSNQSVASVQNGLVTAVNAGNTTITVTTVDGGRTATCNVTVSAAQAIGTISIANTTIEASDTNTEIPISCSDIDVTTIAFSESSAWISSVTRGGTLLDPTVVITTTANSSTDSRSASISVTATDTSSHPVPTSFTLTQRGAVSADIPCTEMSITGVSSITNDGSAAEFTCNYTPVDTTQRNCTWSLTQGNGQPIPSASIQFTTNGDHCYISVVDALSDDLTLRLTATNTANNSIEATKTITASYITPNVISGFVNTSSRNIVLNLGNNQITFPYTLSNGYNEQKNVPLKWEVSVSDDFGELFETRNTTEYTDSKTMSAKTKTQYSKTITQSSLSDYSWVGVIGYYGMYATSASMNPFTDVNTSRYEFYWNNGVEYIPSD